MARRMFKQLALVKTENIGHTGAIFRIAQVNKQSDQMVSAYIDKIRISYHYDVTDSPDGRPDHLGTTFYLANTNSTNLDSTNVISATGSRGYGGTVTLEAKRSIKDSSSEPETGFGALDIHMQPSDLNLAAGDVTVNLVIEVWAPVNKINFVANLANDGDVH